MCYIQFFNINDKIWLEENSETRDLLFAEVEDLSNVNPLENGEPDLLPLYTAINAVKLFIIVASKGLQFSYNANHFKEILRFFPIFLITENKPENFWHYFEDFKQTRKEEIDADEPVAYIYAITTLCLLVKQEGLKFT